jgi:hypothetical protein
MHSISIFAKFALLKATARMVFMVPRCNRLAMNWVHTLIDKVQVLKKLSNKAHFTKKTILENLDGKNQTYNYWKNQKK